MKKRKQLTEQDLVRLSLPVYDVIPEERFKDCPLTLIVMDYNYKEVELYGGWEEFLWFCEEHGFKFLPVGMWPTYESDSVLDCELNRRVLNELELGVDYEC